jgi:hypothetical protein
MKTGAPVQGALIGKISGNLLEAFILQVNTDLSQLEEI